MFRLYNTSFTVRALQINPEEIQNTVKLVYNDHPRDPKFDL